MSTITDDILQGIEAALADCQEEIAALEAARHALTGNGHRPATRVREPRPRATAPRATTALSDNGVTADQVYNTLRTGIDHAPTLAERLNASLNIVRTRLLALEQEGRVRREGERRNTRWFAIPNETPPEPPADAEPVPDETPAAEPAKPKRGRRSTRKTEPAAEQSHSDRKPAAVDDVLALVAHGMSQASAIAEELGVTPQSVGRRLAELFNEGLVAKQGNSWSVTPAGEQNWTELRARELANRQQQLTAIAA